MRTLDRRRSHTALRTITEIERRCPLCREQHGSSPRHGLGRERARRSRSRGPVRTAARRAYVPPLSRAWFQRESMRTQATISPSCSSQYSVGYAICGHSRILVARILARYPSKSSEASASDRRGGHSCAMRTNAARRQRRRDEMHMNRLFPNHRRSPRLLRPACRRRSRWTGRFSDKPRRRQAARCVAIPTHRVAFASVTQRMIAPVGSTPPSDPPTACAGVAGHVVALSAA